EEGRIGATLDALAEAIPGASVFVADDASSDDTPQISMRTGAWVVSRRRPHGKGANVTAAAQAAIGEFGDDATALICDADESGQCDLAVADFTDPHGGGFGIALGYARRAVERLCGTRSAAPLSGQ